jgi:hypothetical protein
MKPEVHPRVYRNPQLVLIRSRIINPTKCFPFCLLTIRFVIILAAMPRYSRWFFFTFPYQTLAWTSLPYVLHACPISCFLILWPELYLSRSTNHEALINKYQQDFTPQYFYFLFCHSLHVSGTFHAHHQEISKLTAYITSGKTTVLCGRPQEIKVLWCDVLLVFIDKLIHDARNAEHKTWSSFLRRFN